MTEPTSPVVSGTVLAAAKGHEPDRYLGALLAPRPARDGLIVLAAFAGEIAQVPLRVKEPLMGEMRLQWWRDAVAAAVTAEPSGNPHADAVGAVIRRHDLDVALIDRMIEAVRLDVYGEGPASEAAMLAHAAEFHGAAFHLACQVLDRGRDPAIAAAASTGGEAYGLARLLVGLPRLLASGQMPFPQQLLDSHGVDAGAMFAGKASDAAQAMIAALWCLALGRTADARAGVAGLPPGLRPAFLPLAMVEPYSRLSQKGGISLREVRDVTPLARIWRLWLAARRT